MEKTSIERLFNINGLEKEDLESINSTIKTMFDIINAQQNMLINIKNDIDALMKTETANTNILLSVNNRVNELNTQFMSINSVLDSTMPTNINSYNRPQQPQQSVVNRRVQTQQPKPKQDTGGFNPLNVGSPIAQNGDTSIPLDPQQMEEYRRIINNQNRVNHR